MGTRDVFDIFDDDNSKKVKNPTFDALLKYQKHHMEILKTYAEQIAFIDKLLRDCREEQKKFFTEDIPAIRKKLTEEHIDKSVQDEWIVRLEKSMTHSFNESHKLASAFAVQKEDEFRESLEEKLKGL